MRRGGEDEDGGGSNILGCFCFFHITPKKQAWKFSQGARVANWSYELSAPPHYSPCAPPFGFCRGSKTSFRRTFRAELGMRVGAHARRGGGGLCSRSSCHFETMIQVSLSLSFSHHPPIPIRNVFSLSPTPASSTPFLELSGTVAQPPVPIGTPTLPSCNVTCS